MRTYKIRSQEDLDKFKDHYGYKIKGNAEFERRVKVEHRLRVEGYLWIKNDDWIRTDDSIEVKNWIKSDYDIEAGGSIKTGGSIEAGTWIEADDSIEADGSIKAGESIKAGGLIEAGGSIEALQGGITLGRHLTCGGTLSFARKLFAGTSPYSWDLYISKEVKCKKLLSGTIVYGDLIETDRTPPEEIQIGGATYVLKG